MSSIFSNFSESQLQALPRAPLYFHLHIPRKAGVAVGMTTHHQLVELEIIEGGL